MFPIEIPPLRDRREDIRPLAQHLLQQSCQRLKVLTPRMTREDLRLLERYDWPGNVRELQNVMERAVILARGGRLRFHLGESLELHRESEYRPAADSKFADGMTLKDVQHLEREVVCRALEQAGWKIHGEGGAAARLGLKPTTLTSRMKTMGLRKPW